MTRCPDVLNPNNENLRCPAGNRGGLCRNLVVDAKNRLIWIITGDNQLPPLIKELACIPTASYGKAPTLEDEHCSCR